MRNFLCFCSYFNHESNGYSSSLLLHSGDIVLLCSDGVWDNVFDEEINSVVESVVHMGESGIALASQIARSVAEYAVTNSHDKSSVSPFYSRYNRIRCTASLNVIHRWSHLMAVDAQLLEANRMISLSLPL